MCAPAKAWNARNPTNGGGPEVQNPSSAGYASDLYISKIETEGNATKQAKRPCLAQPLSRRPASAKSDKITMCKPTGSGYKLTDVNVKQVD